jgi:hypothetical protein
VKTLALCATVITLALVGMLDEGKASEVSTTQVVVGVTPFAADGKLRDGVRVAARDSGVCEPSSEAFSGAVYRCFSAHRVLDPCWRSQRASKKPFVVVCMLRPWENSVVQLTLSKDPGRATGSPTTQERPWGIELASGQRCIEVQGAHDTVNHKARGVVIDYSCGGTLVLLRGVDRSSEWTDRRHPG